MAGLERFCAGQVEDIPTGSMKLVELGGREIGLTRLPDGAVCAVHNICPHKGAPICRGKVGGTWPPSQPGELTFERRDEVLVCPWHGFEYDLRTGAELYETGRTRLLLVPTEVEDGQVMVSLRPRRRPAPDKRAGE